MGIVEEGHVHPEGTVVPDVDQVVTNQIDVNRLAVGGQSHHLVLTAVDPKSRVVGEGRVQESQRVGKPNLSADRHLVFPAVPHGSRGPLSHSIHRDNGGLFKRRREEGAGSVGFVMLTKYIAMLLQPQFPIHFPAQMKLLSHPQWKCFAERSKASWCEVQVGLQESIKLDQRLFVEADVVQPVGRDAGLLEAELDGPGRKAGVVLLPREALLLCGGNDFTVPYQGGCAVVIEG